MDCDMHFLVGYSDLTFVCSNEYFGYLFAQQVLLPELGELPPCGTSLQS